MSALPDAPALQLTAMTSADLDAVLAVEQAAYAFPWTRGNFIDSLAAGYRARLLRAAGRSGGAVAGYTVAMEGVGELHLLNLTVAPDWQRRGLARLLLDDLCEHARVRRLGQLWLEVREGNARARVLYERYGFATIGRRRGYYPAGLGRREDAIVMGMTLHGLD